MLCSRVGTKFAKIHSCFLMEIGLISQILKMLLDETLGIIGGCLFQKLTNMKVQICNNNIFPNTCFHIFSNIS